MEKFDSTFFESQKISQKVNPLRFTSTEDNIFVPGRKNFEGLNKVVTKKYHVPQQSHKKCKFHNNKLVSVWIQKAIRMQKSVEAELH